MATSYNGWPASPDKDEIGVVQSFWFPGGVVAGDVTTVFRYFVEQFNARVEPIVGGWCWGYNYRANANDPSSLSCHASGTALDLNAPEHPNGVRGTFTDAQRHEIYKILDECHGALYWLDGVDGGTADEMHVEACVDAATMARIAAQLLAARPEPEPEPDPLLNGGIDVIVYIINPLAKEEIWVTDGMTKRYVRSLEEVDFIRGCAALQGVQNVPGGSMGAAEVGTATWGGIPVMPDTYYPPH